MVKMTSKKASVINIYLQQAILTRNRVNRVVTRQNRSNGATCARAEENTAARKAEAVWTLVSDAILTPFARQWRDFRSPPASSVQWLDFSPVTNAVLIAAGQARIYFRFDSSHIVTERRSSDDVAPAAAAPNLHNCWNSLRYAARNLANTFPAGKQACRIYRTCSARSWSHPSGYPQT
jgi:hypothetical protein